MFKESISAAWWVIIIGVALILVVAGATALDLVTLPWQQDIKREAFEHSRSAVEGHVEELGRQMAEYNRLEGKIAADPDNEQLVTGYRSQQAAVIQIMWQHYDAIPNDVRAQEVPPDIVRFLADHPRGSQ